MEPYYADQPRWLAMAREGKPALNRRTVAPAASVRVAARDGAFQGWAAETERPWDGRRELAPGETVTLDFGESLVGGLSFAVERAGKPNDAPVRLRVTLAEVPLELAEPVPATASGDGGSISPAWHQEETVCLDALPAEASLSRRYAFRYVRLRWDEYVDRFTIRIAGVKAEHCSSAPFDDPEPPPYLSETDRVLARAANRTLRNCMQAVFEDGPKRDRRLWLGDLRLQALANEAGFGQYALVRRCLLLLAGLSHDDGRVPACVFDFAEPDNGGYYIVDYAALFGATLDDYLRASGDAASARDLYPVALRQAETTAASLDRHARYQGREWVFIDWKEGLERDAALAGVVTYGLRRTASLAAALGLTEDVRRLDALAAGLTRAARTTYWNGAAMRVESGAARQVSHAAWAWWTLAGILSRGEASSAYRRLRDDPGTMPPGGPYLMHHVADALIECGLRDEALSLVRSYWGGMAAAGLDTFPEVWDPGNPRRSPYGTPLLNSYCHAWSCTPLWLLRKLHEPRS